MARRDGQRHLFGRHSFPRSALEAMMSASTGRAEIHASLLARILRHGERAGRRCRSAESAGVIAALADDRAQATDRRHPSRGHRVEPPRHLRPVPRNGGRRGVAARGAGDGARSSRPSPDVHRAVLLCRNASSGSPALRNPALVVPDRPPGPPRREPRRAWACRGRSICRLGAGCPTRWGVPPLPMCWGRLCDLASYRAMLRA